MNINYKKLNSNSIIPFYAHDGDSGLDLFSVEPVKISPFSHRLIDTGIALEIPYGYEGHIRSKSGLALKNGIFVLNSPGTIDSNYRNSIGVILYNLSKKEYIVEAGKKIAQLVICPVKYITLVENELNDANRGLNGFGSTGTDSKQLNLTGE